MLAQVRVGVWWDSVHPRGELRGVSDGWVWEERTEDPDDTPSLLRTGW